MYKKAVLRFSVIFFYGSFSNIVAMQQSKKELAQSIKSRLAAYDTTLQCMKSQHASPALFQDIEKRYFNAAGSLLHDTSKFMKLEDQQKLQFQKSREMWWCLLIACPKMYCCGKNIRDSAHDMSKKVGQHVKTIADQMERD